MTETQNNGGVTKLLPAEGARILVAGGCGGMGRAFVAEVLVHGLQVAVLDLPVSLAGSPPPEGVLQLPCDALDEAQIVAAVKSLEEQWGSLRYLVNFIGFATERCPIESLATAVWDETINGTLRSAFILSRETLRLLRREQESAVVHFASTISVSLTMPGLGAYAAGKAGLLNLVRALALEWAPEIRVNAVAPGVVRTSSSRAAPAARRNPGEWTWTPSRPRCRSSASASPTTSSGPRCSCCHPRPATSPDRWST
jgi:3-oxoacyl-[acyl-carrier protein] reductase